MAKSDIQFRIGGEAGQGLESGGAGFAQALVRAGLYVVGVPDYRSRIRGGHNFFSIRASTTPIYAARDQVDVLVALDSETVPLHVSAIAPGGAIVLDQEAKLPDDVTVPDGVRLVRAPLVQLATEAGNPVMANTAALAVAAALTGFDLIYMLGVIRDNFGRRSAQLAEANCQVAEGAHRWAVEAHGEGLVGCLGAQPAEGRLAIGGNQAFAMGALVAGCKFVAGYPMTPATTVLEYMASHAAEWGIVTKHAESEIAAVNMLVGAAHAGVRAMAPTSGGGFDLMTEGFSLAAMIEAPIVIFLSQRPGPATGLPTRTAQADLNLALYAGHGEFSRIVMAPHSPEEAFGCAIRAFNLADRYQCPVIVLSDQYLSSLVWAADAASFDVEDVPIDRGKLLDADALEAMGDYRRYALVDDGVSPRAIPGLGPKAVYLSTGDEHDEEGHITEDAGLTVAMADKRLRKMAVAASEMRPPLRLGAEQPELTLLSWGSSYGPVREAMEALNDRGVATAMVHFVDLWPFPTEAAREALHNTGRLVAVEGNAQAQFAHLLQAHTGIRINGQVLRYDGRGFTSDYILARLEA